jgi:hypothetical protein
VFRIVNQFSTEMMQQYGWDPRPGGEDGKEQRPPVHEDLREGGQKVSMNAIEPFQQDKQKVVTSLPGILVVTGGTACRSTCKRLKQELEADNGIV